MSPSRSEWRMTAQPACSSLLLKGLPMNPEAPVTRTVLLIWEKRPPVLWELVDGPLVIVGPADIQPVAVVRFHVDRFATRQHVPHEVVKSVFYVRRDALHQETTAG